MTAKQIKETQERFTQAAKANQEPKKTELVLDWSDDSVQMVEVK